MRALFSLSGEAAEDNIVERENFGSGGITGFGLRDTVDGQTDVEVEIVF